MHAYKNKKNTFCKANSTISLNNKSVIDRKCTTCRNNTDYRHRQLPRTGNNKSFWACVSPIDKQTDRQTNRRMDATKRIISPALRSIINVTGASIHGFQGLQNNCIGCYIKTLPAKPWKCYITLSKLFLYGFKVDGRALGYSANC